MLFPHIIYFCLYTLILNAFALNTSRDVIPWGAMSYPCAPTSPVGVWVSSFVVAQSQAEYCLRERPFSTIRSYMCLALLRFYSSSPSPPPNLCGHTGAHLTGLPIPLEARKRKIRGLNLRCWPETWEGLRVPGIERVDWASHPPPPHVALESLSFPNIKNWCHF